MMARLRAHLSWPLAYRAILSTAFLLLLLQPLVRAPERIPTYLFDDAGQWRAPAEIDQTFRQEFPLRNRARKIYAALNLNQLPPNVLGGRDGWLFYRAEVSNDGHSMDDFDGRVAPAPEDLAEWRAAHAERAAAAPTYLAFVAPNKETIYPDKLRLFRKDKAATTRLDRVLAALPPEHLMDLRPVLREARRALAPAEAYYPLDTHWTPLGALAAYSSVALRLGLSPLSEADFRRADNRHQGDLTVMAGKPADEPGIGLLPLGPLPARCAGGAEIYACLTEPGTRAVTEIDDDRLPKAVIFHDSFMVPQAVYLAQHFRRAVFVWGPYDAAVIAEEKPDIVLEEVVERYLPRLFGKPQAR